MREILFRGKRKDNGEWVFGCYYKQSEFYGEKREGIMIITSGESLCYDQALEYYAVHEESVGQFTGLVDKDGRKIFEGDIARYSEPFCCEPRYRTGGVVKFLEGCFCIDRTYLNEWLFDSQGGNTELRDFEVIGNIHDNPELIGGGEDA